jgi:hypothetical protein
VAESGRWEAKKGDGWLSREMAGQVRDMGG